jgi:hypothetical protein
MMMMYLIGDPPELAFIVILLHKWMCDIPLEANNAS